MSETKFCTTCQSMQPLEGGYKKPGSFRGWRCKLCLNRVSMSPYASSHKTKPSDLARIRKELSSSFDRAIKFNLKENT